MSDIKSENHPEVENIKEICKTVPDSEETKEVCEVINKNKENHNKQKP